MAKDTSWRVVKQQIELTPYLTPNDVADYLNVHAIKVRAWITKGKLKAINVSMGKRPEYRIKPEALAEFEKQLQVTGDLPTTQRRRKIDPMRDIPNYF